MSQSRWATLPCADMGRMLRVDQVRGLDALSMMNRARAATTMQIWMTRLCVAIPENLAIVLSQDGGVRFVKRLQLFDFIRARTRERRERFEFSRSRCE